MNFLKFKPVYECTETGRRSVNFVDVLPKQLTIDRQYVPKWLFTDYRTLFKEITIVPPEETLTPEVKELFKETVCRKETKEQLFDKIQAKLEEIVFEQWRPDIFHIHLHSSGLDSRILSWTIRKLYKKYGDGWLGDIMFVSSKWEGTRFREIMKYEGWKVNQYCVVDEQLKDDEYFASTLLNFESIWQETNGPQVKLNNIMWYLVDRTQKKDIIPEHIQLWTSQWGNTVLGHSSQKNGAEITKRYWRMHYLSAIGQCPHKCDGKHIDPLANVELVKLIITSSVCLGEQLRFQLLEAMDKKLSQFIRISEGGRRGPIADWILEQMLKNYQSSWYGKNVCHIKEFPKLNRVNKLWAHYIAASLCEYLLKNGYQIREEK